MNDLRISVLDQAPVPEGVTAAQALANSLSLAEHVDALGYTRLWYSEHHAMPVLACSAPEILITRAAAATSRIRVGSGGIMLPHYASLKVAEVFSTLNAMFPNRIDLGIGRAPGGGQLEAFALRRNRQGPAPDDFPQQLAELRAYLHPERWAAHGSRSQGIARDTESAGGGPHPFSTIHVAPVAQGAAELWLLGSSMWSSVTAAAEGLPYAFAHFFTRQGTREAIEHYRRNFQPQASLPDSAAPRLAAETRGSQDLDRLTRPYAAIAIGVICADTQEEAEHLHASIRLLQRRSRSNDRRPIATPEAALLELNEQPTAPDPRFPFTAGSLDMPEADFPRYVVGTPGKVRDELLHIARELELDELIINTIMHSHEARLRSYSLLAEVMELNNG